MTETLNEIYEKTIHEQETIMGSGLDYIIIYEDSSFVYKDLAIGTCKGSSIRFLGLEGLKEVLIKYICEGGDKELYDFMFNSIFQRGKEFGQNKDLDKKFKIFSGVYMLYKEGEIIYIGQSNNIFNRLGGHRNKDYDEIKFIPCRKFPRKLESELIKKHKPKLNKIGI